MSHRATATVSWPVVVRREALQRLRGRHANHRIRMQEGAGCLSDAPFPSHAARAWGLTAILLGGAREQATADGRCHRQKWVAPMGRTTHVLWPGPRVDLQQ
jgi:hypothetical protein